MIWMIFVAPLCVCVCFTPFHLNSTTTNRLCCTEYCNALIQQKTTHRCLPIGFFVSRFDKIRRNYSNRPIKSHSFDSHIILILTASITNSCYILSTMSYHNILCILGFFSHWFIDFVWLFEWFDQRKQRTTNKKSAHKHRHRRKITLV